MKPFDRGVPMYKQTNPVSYSFLFSFSLISNEFHWLACRDKYKYKNYERKRKRKKRTTGIDAVPLKGVKKDLPFSNFGSSASLGVSERKKEKKEKKEKCDNLLFLLPKRKCFFYFLLFFFLFFIFYFSNIKMEYEQ